MPIIDIKEKIIEVLKGNRFSEVATEIGISQSVLYDFIQENFIKSKDKDLIAKYVLRLKAYKRYGTCGGFFYKIVDEDSVQKCLILLDRDINYSDDSITIGWWLGDVCSFMPKFTIYRAYHKKFGPWPYYTQFSEKELLTIIQRKVFQLNKNWVKYYI